jgi:hypothetical protein
MIMHKLSYFNICKQLVMTDLVVFKKTIPDKIVDMAIWVTLSLFVTGYIMPYFGLSKDFGPVQFGGIVASLGLFEVYSSIFELMADLEGDQVISYGLTLPIPSWMAIMSKAIYYAITYFVLSVIMLPVGKLCLWDQLAMNAIVYHQLLFILLLQSIFYACFALWTTTFVRNLSGMGSIWARFIFPMWFMGGFQFSWLALHHVLPIIAYVDLLNPVTYITEGTRAALLGQSGYLNFWLCCGALALFSIACTVHALYRMKKRLDFV